MSFLPVVERELRVISRRPSAYWQRIGMAFSSLVLVIAMLSIQVTASAAQLSMYIFGMHAYMMLFYCFFQGIASTSDCFTSEKREGTLGLLFLTDLKGYDVVFGKLVSNSVQSLFNLLSVTPLMAIPLLMGGVSFNLFWRFSLGLLNLLFFSLSAGILASAWCKTDRKARSIASSIVLLLTIGFPLSCAIVCDWLMTTPPAWIQILLSLINPLAPLIDTGGAINLPALTGLFTKGFGSMRAYWPTLLSSNLIAWLFLLLASRIVPHSWQDKPEQAWFERFFRRGRKKEEDWTSRHKNKRLVLDANPFYWLCRRFYINTSPLQWVLVLEAVFFLYLLSEQGMDIFKPPGSIMIPLFVGATIKWAAASQAVRPMVEQRRQGSLELLLATSMPVEEILKGARSAMNRAFLPSLIFCLAVDLFFMFTTFATLPHATISQSDISITFWSFVAGIAFLFIDYYAIVSLAMWHGISSKKPVNAAGTAVFGILVLPWFLWYGSILFYFIGLRKNIGPPPNGHWILAYWVFIGLAVSFLLGATSYINLRNRFRECAMERFQPEKPGWIERATRFFRTSKDAP